MIFIDVFARSLQNRLKEKKFKIHGITDSNIVSISVIVVNVRDLYIYLKSIYIPTSSRFVPRVL